MGNIFEIANKPNEPSMRKKKHITYPPSNLFETLPKLNIKNFILDYNFRDKYHDDF